MIRLPAPIDRMRVIEIGTEDFDDTVLARVPHCPGLDGTHWVLCCELDEMLAPYAASHGKRFAVLIGTIQRHDEFFGVGATFLL